MLRNEMARTGSGMGSGRGRRAAYLGGLLLATLSVACTSASAERAASIATPALTPPMATAPTQPATAARPRQAYAAPESVLQSVSSTAAPPPAAVMIASSAQEPGSVVIASSAPPQGAAVAGSSTPGAGDAMLPPDTATAAAARWSAAPASTPAAADQTWQDVATSPAASGTPAPQGTAAGRAAPRAAAAQSTPLQRYSGLATYYGADFDGKPTASGMIYNMMDPGIVASNYWPLGTRLQIWRVPGGPWDGTLSPAERAQFFGHSLIVTVLDRGHFTHALDLSYGAFSLLGRPSEGVISLMIVPLEGTAPSWQLRDWP